MKLPRYAAKVLILRSLSPTLKIEGGVGVSKIQLASPDERSRPGNTVDWQRREYCSPEKSAAALSLALPSLNPRALLCSLHPPLFPLNWSHNSELLQCKSNWGFKLINNASFQISRSGVKIETIKLESADPVYPAISCSQAMGGYLFNELTTSIPNPTSPLDLREIVHKRFVGCLQGRSTETLPIPEKCKTQLLDFRDRMDSVYKNSLKTPSWCEKKCCSANLWEWKSLWRKLKSTFVFPSVACQKTCELKKTLRVFRVE